MLTELIEAAPYIPPEEYADAFGGTAWESYYTDMETQRDDPETAALHEFILLLAEHLFLASEVIAHKAERRPPRPPKPITEEDFCPL